MLESKQMIRTLEQDVLPFPVEQDLRVAEFSVTNDRSAEGDRGLVDDPERGRVRD